jgi:ABC-2 type transport system permease protein
MITMMRKDALTGARDQLTLYMLLSPILLGLMLALILPILEHARPSFVVSEALDQADREALAAHGEVELVADREAVVARVLARDDVTGVVPRDGDIEVIVEGDEPEPLRALPWAILEHDIEPLEPVAGDPATPPLRLIATSLTVYCVTVIVGLMIGFAILEEKITNVYVAFDVSPLRFAEYLGAKLMLGLALALGMTIPAIALPLGFAVDWVAVLVTIVASMPFAVSLGLLIGVLAKDQLGAVATMKALLPIWTSLPVLGFVLPDAWLWTQFPFANHWGVQGLFHALGDGVGVWTCAGLNLATGLPVLIATAWVLRRKLGFA